MFWTGWITASAWPPCSAALSTRVWKSCKLPGARAWSFIYHHFHLHLVPTTHAVLFPDCKLVSQIQVPSTITKLSPHLAQKTQIPLYLTSHASHLSPERALRQRSEGDSFQSVCSPRASGSCELFVLLKLPFAILRSNLLARPPLLGTGCRMAVDEVC